MNSLTKFRLEKEKEKHTSATTDTHSEYVTGIVFPRQKCLRERATFLHLYVHCLSC
jgi:hypothetical protein